MCHLPSWKQQIWLHLSEPDYSPCTAHGMSLIYNRNYLFYLWMFCSVDLTMIMLLHSITLFSALKRLKRSIVRFWLPLTFHFSCLSWQVINDGQWLIKRVIRFSVLRGCGQYKTAGWIYLRCQNIMPAKPLLFFS